MYLQWCCTGSATPRTLRQIEGQCEGKKAQEEKHEEDVEAEQAEAGFYDFHIFWLPEGPSWQSLGATRKLARTDRVWDWSIWAEGVNEEEEGRSEVE